MFGYLLSLQNHKRRKKIHLAFRPMSNESHNFNLQFLFDWCRLYENRYYLEITVHTEGSRISHRAHYNRVENHFIKSMAPNDTYGGLNVKETFKSQEFYNIIEKNLNPFPEFILCLLDHASSL